MIRVLVEVRRLTCRRRATHFNGTLTFERNSGRLEYHQFGLVIFEITKNATFYTGVVS